MHLNLALLEEEIKRVKTQTNRKCTRKSNSGSLMAYDGQVDVLRKTFRVNLFNETYMSHTDSNER